MAVIYDRSARTFIVTMGSERSEVREHRAEHGARTTMCSESARRGLYKAGQEVVNVLMRASPARLRFEQLHDALPHVAQSTLYSRLRDMAERGDVKRLIFSNHSKRGAICGGFKDFLYCLTTAAST